MNSQQTDISIDETKNYPSVGCYEVNDQKTLNKSIKIFQYFPDEHPIVIEGPNPSDPNCPKIYIYTHDYFSADDDYIAKVILLTGKTGDGKTTLINSLMNFLKGIKFEDFFRYKLIIENNGRGQNLSQTKGIHVHKIKMKDGTPLKIIDSQGFCDVEEKFKGDENIQSLFKILFTNEIEHVNVVGFVVNGTVDRLTEEQTYIFARITGLFTESVMSNIVFLATKRIGDEEPLIVSSLREAQSFYFIPKIHGNWYYSFDNKKVFEGKKNKASDKEVWDLTEASMKDFIKNKILGLPSVDTKLAADQLEMKDGLKKKYEKLKENLKKSIQENDSLEGEKRTLEKQRQKLQELNNEKLQKENEIKKLNLNKDQEEKALTELSNEYAVKVKAGFEKDEVQSQTHYKLIPSEVYNWLCNKCHKCCHYECSHKPYTTFYNTCYNYTKNEDENGRKYYTCNFCGCNLNDHMREKLNFVEEKEQKNVRVIDTEKKRNNETEYTTKKLTSQNKINNLIGDIATAEKDRDKKLAEYGKLSEQIEKKEKEIIEKEKQIFKKRREIIALCKKVQDTNKKINSIALNKNLNVNIEDYINSLLERNEFEGENDQEIRTTLLKELSQINLNKEIMNMDTENMEVEEIMTILESVLNNQ